jgi:hypothetical protein
VAKAKSNPTLDALTQAAKGLKFVSETEAALEAFAWPGGSSLNKATICKQAGRDSKTDVQTMTLQDFFHAVPAEDKAKFDQLATVLTKQLTGLKVYKVGDEAEKQVFIVGKSTDGQWAGLKTSVVET